MADLKPEDVTVKSLGQTRVKSPLNLSTSLGDGVRNFTDDDVRVRYKIEIGPEENGDELVSFEKSGPRETIYFSPEETKAAIVTCGGLCPGINNVIRSIFLELYHNYGVKDVLGIRFGYQGMNRAKGKPPILMTPEFVEHIHRKGGSVLGSSRGAEDPADIVDYLEKALVNILFCIGGDGTQRGAHDIAEEIARRGLEIAVVGIPKTIDNDIMYVWRTFGYSTAVETARDVIDCAHMEAKGAPNGIGLVKVMGRDAGFIAAGATTASQEVNFTLIPEEPFSLAGEGGFLEVLKKRILTRGHAVVVVAEGAGQDLIEEEATGRDTSGNIKYKDIGVFLKKKIEDSFAGDNTPCAVKYIDPSYIIRSVPANGEDSVFCDALARNAVHAAMAGKTDMLVGLWYDVFIHVPIELAVSGKKCIDLESSLWWGVLSATGQPRMLGGDRRTMKRDR